MILRPYQDNDFPQFERILRDTKLYYGPLDRRDIFQRQIDHDPESIIVAENSGTVIGGVIVLYQPFFSSIWHLCVDPAYQKQGIGSKLLKRVEESLKARGIERVGIFVDRENKDVLEFYNNKNRGWISFSEVIPLEKII